MRSEGSEAVDEYISAVPAAVGKRLQAVRGTIRRAVPEAEESISYRIPAYKLHGALIYFAAFQDYIGMYPITASLKDALADELAPYLAPRAKSTAHFRHDMRLPLGLIARMVKIRRAENLARAAAKGPGARKTTAAKAAAGVPARSKGRANRVRRRQDG